MPSRVAGYDLASAIVHVMRTEESTLYEAAPGGLINAGVGEDLSISELAGKIKAVVGATNKIEYDASKPDGTPRKLVDVTRLFSLGWRPTVSLEEGLRRTYDWFLKNEEAS